MSCVRVTCMGSLAMASRDGSVGIVPAKHDHHRAPGGGGVISHEYSMP